MFLCHKTEYPDELSFQKKQQQKNIQTALNAICINGIEFANYDETYTI